MLIKKILIGLVICTFLLLGFLLVVPLMMKRPTSNVVIREKTDVNSIVNALELYRLDNFSYPTTEQGLKALVELPTIEPIPKNWNKSGYLKSLSKDRWGRAYVYKTGGDADYEVYSLGKDGLPGGTGYNADISSIVRDTVWVGEEAIPFEKFLSDYKINQRLKTNPQIQSDTNIVLQAGCTLKYQDTYPPNCMGEIDGSSQICKGQFSSVFTAADGSLDQQDYRYEWNSRTKELHMKGLQGFLIMPEECENGMDADLRWKNNQ